MFKWFQQRFTSLPKEVRERLQTPWQRLKFVAIDLELTGLNTEQDEIVSIGWQPICEQILAVDQAVYSICQASKDLAQSPAIHGITEQQLQTGIATQKILQQLAPMMNDHIWVFHNTQMDMGILSRYLNSYRLWQHPIITLDTLLLQRYLLNKTSEVIAQGQATLSASRAFFGLNRAPDHQALDDAFATAELLLAQLHRLSGGQAMQLAEIKHTGALKIYCPNR